MTKIKTIPATLVIKYDLETNMIGKVKAFPVSDKGMIDAEAYFKFLIMDEENPYIMETLDDYADEGRFVNGKCSVTIITTGSNK